MRIIPVPSVRTIGALAGLALSAGLLVETAQAQLVFRNPTLSGTTDYDEWRDLVAARLGGNYSPGTWLEPIGSAIPGNPTGDANLNKVSGGAYPATFSLYTMTDSALAVTDTTPVADLKTIVFQIDIGEAEGVDFTSDGLPTLTLNNSIIIGLANFMELVDREFMYDFPIPGTDEVVPIYENVWGFQWDLSSFSSPITSFAINWEVTAHTQIYGLRLDQSSVMTQVVIPEPSTYLLLGAGILTVMFIGYRRRRKQFLSASP